MLEDILASVDDNLDVSEEVLQEVKKLFVTKKKVPISITELSPSIKDQLEMIDADKLYYDKLLTRKDILTSRIADVIQTHPDNIFEIGVGSIKVPKEKIYKAEILDDIIDIGGILDGAIYEGSIVDDAVKPTDVLDDVVDAGNIREKEIAEGSIRDVATDKIPDSVNIRNKEKVLETKEIADSAVVMDSAVKDISTENATVRSMNTVNVAAETDMVMKNISAIKAVTATRSIGQMAMMQPHGARISASLTTKFDGYQRNYDLLKAQKAFYYRQTLKLDKKYELLSNKWVEEPGIIPKTLDELHGVLGTFRTEEQPRIDLVLDNVNANLEESKETLSKANDTMDSVKNALSILDFDTKYLKIGGMIIGGLIVLDLFVGLIVLIRMALGF